MALNLISNPKNCYEPNDWRWQLKNSIKNFEQLKSRLELSEAQKSWLEKNFAKSHLPFSFTPHFASLMGQSAECPIFLQVVSSSKELLENEVELRDPLGEEVREKVPHLVHRYPDRVLFLATDRCASYCRFCTRKRFVGQGPTPGHENYEQAFSYIEKNQGIREIIFSGGDPLILSDQKIDYFLKRSFALKNIRNVRFHSRMLSFAPMRITSSLSQIFSRYAPIFLVTHFNHEKEICEQSRNALKILRQSGVVLLNQSVLLKGINDRVSDLENLFSKLISCGVKPYYLHQCDLVTGASHFRVPIKKSIELLGSLRGKISGLMMPTLVIDIPNGHGKVPMLENPVVREDEKFIYLKGFDGGVSAYPKD